jgi:hypothetical protein
MVALPRQLGEERRRCPMCGRRKALRLWPKDSARKTSVHSRCKSCHAQTMREARMRLSAEKARARKAELHAQLEAGEAKRCIRCGTLRALSDFSRNKRYADGIGNYCRPCEATRKNAYYVGVHKPRAAATCECGRTRTVGAEACDACLRLDGRGRGDGSTGLLLSEMRAMGGTATMAALVEETGLCERQVYRIVAELEAGGRILRRHHEDENDSHGDAHWTEWVAVLIDAKGHE